MEFQESHVKRQGQHVSFKGLSHVAIRTPTKLASVKFYGQLGNGFAHPRTTKHI